MAQESISLEGAKLGNPGSFAWMRVGLKWKISGAFIALIILLGALVCSVVYYLTGNALHKQADLRALAIATNLSDAAAGHVSRKNSLELDALIAKYGRLDGVAYAYIQDPKGQVIATSLQPFPPELNGATTSGNPSVPRSRETKVRGKAVYETQVPLLDGQLGSVHIGLWAGTVQDAVQSTVHPILVLIALCVLGGIAASFALTTKLLRPIVDLKIMADDISRGHLDTIVSIQANDEVGELAVSIERMRASLKAAMARLTRGS